MIRQCGFVLSWPVRTVTTSRRTSIWMFAIIRRWSATAVLLPWLGLEGRAIVAVTLSGWPRRFRSGPVKEIFRSSDGDWSLYLACHRFCVRKWLEMEEQRLGRW